MIRKIIILYAFEVTKLKFLHKYKCYSFPPTFPVDRMLQVFHILSSAEYKPRRGFANIQDAGVLLKYQSIMIQFE